MKLASALVLTFVVVLFMCLYIKKQNEDKKERLGGGGYNAISALAFNNQDAVCYGPNATGSNSGGCYIPHRVIV